MYKYLSIILTASLFSGIQAVSLGNVVNNSDQSAYLISYAPQFTGRFVGTRGQTREEASFYRVSDPVVYVIAGREQLNAEEVLETSDNQDSKLVLITKKGEKFLNQSRLNINLVIAQDGTSTVS